MNRFEEADAVAGRAFDLDRIALRGRRRWLMRKVY